VPGAPATRRPWGSTRRPAELPYARLEVTVRELVTRTHGDALEIAEIQLTPAVIGEEPARQKESEVQALMTRHDCFVGRHLAGADRPGRIGEPLEGLAKALGWNLRMLGDCECPTRPPDPRRRAIPA
jgi:hypothetical protein